MFSSEFCEISKKTFFTDHLPVAASKTFVFFIFVLIQRGHDGPCTKLSNLYPSTCDTSKCFKTSFRDCSSCVSKIQINEILKHRIISHD